MNPVSDRTHGYKNHPISEQQWITQGIAPCEGRAHKAQGTQVQITIPSMQSH